MTLEEIIRTQERIGTKPDGFWGSKSTLRCQEYLRGMMPHPARFPEQSDVSKFYGKHGVKGGYTPPLKTITLPFPVYYNGVPMTTLKPHEKCAASLLCVFERLAVVYPTEKDREKSGILDYYGIYNPRLMRGGTSWSMHSWAIAIDLDADANMNSSHWPTGSHMPIEVMECFAAEGWMSAGAFFQRDAMHFQATQP